MPYYIVNENSDGQKKQHLVSAKNQAAALRAITEPRFTVETASAGQAVKLVQDGAKVIEG